MKGAGQGGGGGGGAQSKLYQWQLLPLASKRDTVWLVKNSSLA